MAQTIPLFGGSGVFPSSSGLESFESIVTTDTDLVSADISADDGSEFIFNMCNHFHNVISSGEAGAVNITSSTNQSLNGDALIKNIFFTFNLDFDLSNLDVQAEADD